MTGERLNVVWRGQCGGWVVEWPNGDFTDGQAVESARKYLDFYGGLEDFNPAYDGDEACEHGVRLDGDCAVCCEEFMVQQFASCRITEGQTEAEVVEFVQGMHGFTEIVPAERVAALVGDVFKNPNQYFYAGV